MNINVFEHQLFGKVRKTNDETGNVWMAAVDVCNVLEYKDLRKAIQRYVQNIDKKLIIINKILIKRGVEKNVKHYSSKSKK